MRKVSVSSLQPGLKVAQTVYSSIGEILLEEGIILNSRYIKNLVRIGIPYIYIDDGLLKDVIVEDVITLETRTAAVQQVKNILLMTKEAGKLVIEPTSVYKTVGNFTETLLSNQSLMVNLVDLKTQDDYTFAHSVNVCVLALMTGINLGYNSDQLATLGVGALLHDLGKVNIPDAILNKPDKLTPQEFAIMKKHPSFGYKLISSSKDLQEEQAIIALQHHESYDGSGYPQGINGEEFHEFAQVVAIADKFDALTANRIYRKAFPSYEAYEMCAASGNYYFKDHVAKAFLNNISAYPAGSLVELTTGQIAVVLETPKGYSRFPKVRLLFDRNHNQLPSTKDIFLHNEVGVYVVRVLEDNNICLLLSKYNK